MRTHTHTHTNLLAMHEMQTKRHIKANFSAPIECKIWKNGLDMGCNIVASQCINRFIYQWGLFVMPMYHDMGETCASHNILHMSHLTTKSYASHDRENISSIHVSAHPIVCHSSHCFDMT